MSIRGRSKAYSPASWWLITLASLIGGLAFGQEPDTDQDGIPDRTEHDLLERYRPFYAFAKNEDYRPQDVLVYIQSSKLLKVGDEGSPALIDNTALKASPNLVLTANVQGNDPRWCSNTAPGSGHQITCLSNLLLNRYQTDYRINPLEHPPGGPGGDPGRHGAEWESVQRVGNIGLYGHVVPVKLNPDIPFGDCSTRWTNLPVPTDKAVLFYKVEYWQFFGYNSEDEAYIGDHEGDWASVQMLIAPAVMDFSHVGHPGLKAPEKIVAVMMYAHGLEFRFDLHDQDLVVMAGPFEEHRGSNFGKSVDIGLNGQQCDSAAKNAQQNLVRLAKDPVTQRFTHPVVFPERGGHEFWPTTDWSYKFAQKHDGEGVNFLSTTPPNLGEVEMPMDEYPGALAILRFNGLWGAFSRINTPPPGPPLHGQWTYPANSSIGWLLPKRNY